MHEPAWMTILRRSSTEECLLSSLLHEQSRIRRLNEDLESRIRESKHLEIRLAMSESRYRQIVENSPNAILTLDSEGRVISCNPSIERILGYEPTADCAHAVQRSGSEQQRQPSIPRNARRRVPRTIFQRAGADFSMQGRHHETNDIKRLPAEGFKSSGS